MNDITIEAAVRDELAWEPSVDAAPIGIAVREGAVTLYGNVESYAAKLAAGKAASRVKDVREIVDEIQVKLDPSDRHSDRDLSAHIDQALAWNVTLPPGSVTATVERGWVRLAGTVSWQYQKVAAFEDVHRLGGVVGITNQIEVKPAVEASQLRARLTDSLKRSAAVDADGICIRAIGGQLKLRGKVGSLHERILVERAAWRAPGVTEVRDEIQVA